MAISMDDRERAFESKWAHDAEVRFRAESLRNRALGEWAAEKKGLTGAAAEELVAAIIAAAFEKAGHESVFGKLRSELDVSVSDAAIRAKMDECLRAALEKLTNDAGQGTASQ
jgi:hypothetical protein